MRLSNRYGLLLTILLVLFSVSQAVADPAGQPAWMGDSIEHLRKELVSRHGAEQAPRVERGLKQMADFWRDGDGSREEFEAFVTENFAGTQQARDTMFERFETLLEALSGHMLEIQIAFQLQSDLDRGPIEPYDEVFGAYDPSAHVNDDFFENKLAFVVLLNFPLTTLEQRLERGAKWSRRQWAEARLAEAFSKRIPAEVSQAISQAAADSGNYISQYNIWMHHLVDKKGKRLFPPKLRLLSHWNLRDELKAQYENAEGGLARQRMIQKVMERIVTQTIPEVVVDNPHVDWDPVTNEVSKAAVNDSGTEPPADLKISDVREPDTRYRMLLNDFLASRKVDAYSPTAPTLIARRFNEDREIPEERVRAMFEEMLSSPLLAQVAKLIESRVGRPLEPFDIWYNGFRAPGGPDQATLDEIVAKKYPTADAYRADMPNMLVKLGFSEERAKYLMEYILVQPARGSGHAAGAAMRYAKARLRTRVGENGMDYKGYNIAVHEMGHNVEQVLSLNEIDHTLLSGVPNTAFTEALAFVFQERDLELLGMASPDPMADALKDLDGYWGACEIAAVALVDMGVWHWMYDHPDATPEDLKNATVQIAKDVWNKYYAPILGKKDVVLLGIYSHMISSFLYLPDYPIGSMIALQINEQVKKAGSIGPEFERMVMKGRVAPDLWMVNATGKPVGPGPLLRATERALEQVRK